MMTSSNGNIFRVTGPSCGELPVTGEFPSQRPVTRSFDVFFDLRLNKRLSNQSWGWWFETPSRSLYVIVMTQWSLHNAYRAHSTELQFAYFRLMSRMLSWVLICTMFTMTQHSPWMNKAVTSTRSGGRRETRSGPRLLDRWSIVITRSLFSKILTMYTS